MRFVHRNLLRGGFAAVVVVALGVSAAGPVAARPSTAQHPLSAPHRFVYTQTNSASGNEILGFSWNGSGLDSFGSWSTGGDGTGTWLGSQGSVAIEGDRLYVVDAGTNDVAMFKIGKGGELRLLDREEIAGVRPVSVSVDGDAVVVLSTEWYSPCGGIKKCGPVQKNVCAGVQRCGIGPEDHLNLLRRHGDSLQLVDNVRLGGFGGSQVSFVDHPGRRRVVVTEKSTNTIDNVTISAWAFGPPKVISSAGSTPYGFGIARHETMVVSNAESEVPGAGTVSSYSLRHGAVSAVTSALATGQQAPCWVAIGEGGRTAYVSNPDSNTISLLRIGHDGTLSLAAASAGPTNDGPIDLQVHHRLLFSDSWETIQVHRIADDGTLSLVAGAPIPQYAQGIAIK
jgi:hypothetical protein